MQLIKYILLIATISFFKVATANPIKFFQTQFNTDWVYAGYGGMRGVGTGTIILKGVSGTIRQAYLYWHGPTSSTDPNANALINFNGHAITGTNIGFSDANFWDFTNSQAYRADVTTFITGDGRYRLSEFIKPKIEINGVSLVVFFDDGNHSNNVDIVLFDGNDANFENQFDSLGWNITLNNINYVSGSANLILGVSDGQKFHPKDDGSITVNGTTIASGGIFHGASVSNGSGGAKNGGLWDIHKFDISSLLGSGLNTLQITQRNADSNVKGNDALSVIHVAIELPVGAAPQQPLPETPAVQSQPLSWPCFLILPSFILALLIFLARFFYIRKYLNKY